MQHNEKKEQRNLVTCKVMTTSMLGNVKGTTCLKDWSFAKDVRSGSNYAAAYDIIATQPNPAKKLQSVGHRIAAVSDRGLNTKLKLLVLSEVAGATAVSVAVHTLGKTSRDLEKVLRESGNASLATFMVGSFQCSIS
ncbi:hypothetical protein V7S43_010754 [Phytophthora oleae]|uniref:Uncharacterized protein n=1 Tax=Phytophthora oleae TaxID=2107226 RepID=A0ABD3FCD2_9STRA